MTPIVEKSREPPRMRIIFRNSHHDPCHSILPYSALPLQGLTSYICATSLCIYWRKLKCRIFRPGPSSAQLSVCSKAGHHFRHSSLLYTAEDTIHTSSHAQQAGSRQPLQHPEPGEHQTHAHTHAPTLEMVIGGPNTPKWPFKPPPQTKRHHECQLQPHKARPTEASSDRAQTKLKTPSSMIHGLLVPPLPPRQQPYAWWRSNTKKERQSPWSPPV